MMSRGWEPKVGLMSKEEKKTELSLHIHQEKIIGAHSKMAAIASQEERPHSEAHLLAHRSWTSQLPEL